MKLRTTHLLAATAIFSVVLLVMWASRPDTDEQVAQLFADIRTGLEEYDADTIMAKLDEQYDIAAHWPRARDLPTGEATLRETVHALARRYLTAIKLRGGRPPRFTCQIHDVVESDDTIVVEATVALDDVPRAVRVAPARQASFRLRRHGWLRPTLRIIGHDPLH
ncbi:MAG: hypothetical protein ACOCYN_00155 [Planctomycetota bacterium]